MRALGAMMNVRFGFADRRRERLHPESGVTLVEMMVVIVIVGLVTAVVAFNVLPMQERARVEKARTDLRNIEQALEMFKLDQGRFPTMEEGLAVLASAKANGDVARARGEGYIRRLPKDPWGQDYAYVIPGEKGAFDLYSLGADAKEGGEGPDADIGNWE